MYLECGAPRRFECFCPRNEASKAAQSAGLQIRALSAFRNHAETIDSVNILRFDTNMHPVVLHFALREVGGGCNPRRGSHEDFKGFQIQVQG